MKKAGHPTSFVHNMMSVKNVDIAKKCRRVVTPPMPGPKSRMKKEERHPKQIAEKVVTPPMPGPKSRMKKEGHLKQIPETVVTPPMPGPKPRMKKEEGHHKQIPETVATPPMPERLALKRGISLLF